MAGKDFNEMSKLIAEIRKPAREMLFNMGHVNYKNTALKQVVWCEIAEALSVDKTKLQAQWKLLKTQYKTALAKFNAPSGSARRVFRPKEDFLLKEMEFIRPYVEDSEIRSTTYIDKNTQDIQNLFDEFAADSGVLEISSDMGSTSTPNRNPKKPKLHLETELLSSLKRIEELSSKKQNSSSDDAFYNFLKSEMEKLPIEKKEELKKKFINMIFEV